MSALSSNDLAGDYDASKTAKPRFSVRNKIGFYLCLLLGIGDLPSLLLTPSGDNQGPPLSVSILDTLCGLVTVIAAVVVLRTMSRQAIRLVAGSRILSALTAIPAFFADGLPAGIRIFAATGVVITIIAVALLLAPAGRHVVRPITD